MCSKAVILLVLCAAVHHVAGFAIREKKEDLSASLHTLDRYKERLLTQGLIPKSEQDQPTNLRNFDELELLQLIPITIKQLRHGQLTHSERVSLRNIYGEIWSLMVEESRRKRYDSRDEVLAILLNSREVRLGKQEIQQQFNSDVKGNTVQKIYNSGDSKPIHLTDDLTVDPPQRLLRMVAAIVQKAYKDGVYQPRSTGGAVLRKGRSSRSISLENVKVTIHVPRVKRSLLPAITLKSTEGLSPEEKRRVEEANDEAIMAAVLAQIGDNDLEDYDDDDEEDDDYYDEEEEEEVKQAEPEAETKLDDEKKQATGFDSEPSMDYAYDDVRGNDDYFDDEYKPRFSAGDFDNPSVNELIMLGAKHRKNSSPSLVKSVSFKTASDDSDEQDYEY